MVRVEKEKIIIEIESMSPENDLLNLQTAIVNTLACMDREMMFQENINPLLFLLREFLPASLTQLRNLYNIES